MPVKDPGRPGVALALPWYTPVDMSVWLFLATLLPLQEGTTADRLKRDGWKAVEELGAQAKLKPELEKLSGTDDPELAWWAGAALAELEAREKGAAAYVDVRRVTLEAKERKAHELLSELLALENLRLVGDLSPAQKPLTVRFASTPFFQATDEVCREAGCVLRRKPNGDFEVKNSDGRPGRPIAYSGPLSFDVTSLALISRAEFRRDPEHSLMLGLAVQTDPRVWLRARGSEWRIVSARDDTGAAVEILSEGSRGWSGDHQPMRISMDPSLARPGNGARKIARLRGIATLLICRAPQEIQFDDVLTTTDQQRQAGDLKITFKRLTFEDRKYIALLEYAPKEAPGAPELSDLVLESAQGKRFSHGSGGMGGGVLFTEFRASENGTAPARLRLTALPDLHS